MLGWSRCVCFILLLIVLGFFCIHPAAQTMPAGPLSAPELQAPSHNLAERIALIVLFPFMLAFAFIVFIFYRQKREADFQRQRVELEMRAFRTQMNPHFIYNCLNSIYQFIEFEETREAGDYLIKFSRLIRRVLDNSIHQEVALSEDVETLKLYLELEQMRTHNRFTFCFDVDLIDSPEQIAVPALIIQPFVENSIWHGFSSIDSGGLIRISITQQDKELKFVIRDNGQLLTIIERPELEKVEKRISLGLSLTRERLNTINRAEGASARFVITDIYDAAGTYCGKLVELYLPLKFLPPKKEDVSHDYS